MSATTLKMTNRKTPQSFAQNAKLHRIIIWPALLFALFAWMVPLRAQKSQEGRSAEANSGANEVQIIEKAFADLAEEKGSSPVRNSWLLKEASMQKDFPAMDLAPDGTPWIALISHDGKADILQLAAKIGDEIKTITNISTPGIVHQPAIACGKDGSVWCFWGQVDSRDIVTLRARQYTGEKLQDEIVLATSGGSDTFADAGTDHAGRIWVAWQSLRRGQADVFARWLDPKSGTWSPEIQVSKPMKAAEEGGNWEPRLAFDGKDGAFVVFDSSRQAKEFDLYVARVSLDGKSEESQLTNSPAYEARASVVPSADGKSLWVAAERGREQWGMEQRGHNVSDGINGGKRILFGKYDIAEKTFREIPVPGDGRFSDRDGSMVTNLPTIALDAGGAPCLAWRFYTFGANHWTIRMSRYQPATGSWSEAMGVPNSSFCQDRRVAMRTGKDGLLLCFAADGRKKNESLHAYVAIASLVSDFGESKLSLERPGEQRSKPYLRAPAADRPLEEHHTWEIGGKKYRLLFGDLHRHTDFSNCKLGGDGCLVEHFRYALDVANLDFLGTSDHTDIGKVYTPYEWWQTQKHSDVFFVPGKFTPLYAYEREQLWPWGHRNIVFPQRGGPVVYINRAHWLASPWKEFLPGRGAGEITPMELWRALENYGKPVAIISHTGASNMGTDWDRYKATGGIDNNVENSVEIFQGARQSYEGIGSPQPAVGLRQGQESEAVPISNYGKDGMYNRGVYQRALSNGYKLGVFASSDHIAQHTAFGGVYVEEETRNGMVDGLRLRRSIAATDKIFVEFSCDDHPMGEVFDCKGKPVVSFAVQGTGPISRVTLVRNETNYQAWEGDALKHGTDGRAFATTFTDPEPLQGENRYYLRVEQADGNMAWSSPVWVTVK